MAKCWYCKTKKGKRYCEAIDNLLCPICCAKNRMVNINCQNDCRYLEGAFIRIKREEEKRFSALIKNVPHGQYDDILYDDEIAMIAAEIETFVLECYMNEDYSLTDKKVFECFKNLYKMKSYNQQLNEDSMNDFMIALIKFYDDIISEWQEFDTEEIMQIFLRLMHSIEQMTGKIMGEFGYLNFLKNNLHNPYQSDQFIIEDKHGKKTKQSITKNIT